MEVLIQVWSHVCVFSSLEDSSSWSSPVLTVGLQIPEESLRGIVTEAGGEFIIKIAFNRNVA